MAVTTTISPGPRSTDLAGLDEAIESHPIWTELRGPVNAMISVTPGTSAPTTTYTYADAGNSLRTAGAYTSGGVTTSFIYVNGPLGVTARQVTNDGAYTGSTYYTRDPQGNLIDEHGGPAGTNFYETDQRGDVVALSTGVGVATATYVYTPLGGITETNVTGSDAVDNPFTYTGAYEDVLEHDLFDHLGTRYYRRNGLFNQADGQPTGITSPQEGNLFS